MCGRFALTATPSEVEQLFEIAGLEPFPPRYNIAPTQPVAVVRASATGREGALVRWGLVPHWVKDPASFTLLINARSETAAEKPAFRAPMRHRRCLVPASGFYEWQRSEGGKIPFWVAPADGSVTAFAGVWDSWMGKDGSEIDSVAILTTAATPSLAAIHHRMPVVVPPEQFDLWLDPVVEPREVAHLLIAPADDYFAARAVGDAVNAARNDGPDLQLARSEEADAAPASTEAGRPRKTARKTGPTGDGQMDLF